MHARPWYSALGTIAVLAAGPLQLQAQQAAAFESCTSGALANCSLIELFSSAGVGPGGANLFRIAIENLGSQTTPSLATSIYNLVFLTGQANAPAGSEIDAPAQPHQVGGATVVDASSWDLFDDGSAIFLSALDGNGVGGCVAGSPVGEFSQAGLTCGSRQFLTFDFFTTRMYDPSAFSLADLEVVGLTSDLPADSCNDAAPCAITPAPLTSTPEPSSIVLALTGMTGAVGAGWRRRRGPR